MRRKKPKLPRRLCSLEVGRRPRWCSWMDKSLAPLVNAALRGLVVVERTMVATGKKEIVGVAYKRDAKDCGVFIHKCPWCEVDLLKVITAHYIANEIGGKARRGSTPL